MRQRIEDTRCTPMSRMKICELRSTDFSAPCGAVPDLVGDRRAAMQRRTRRSTPIGDLSSSSVSNGVVRHRRRAPSCFHFTPTRRAHDSTGGRSAANRTSHPARHPFSLRSLNETTGTLPSPLLGPPRRSMSMLTHETSLDLLLVRTPAAGGQRMLLVLQLATTTKTNRTSSS